MRRFIALATVTAAAVLGLAAASTPTARANPPLPLSVGGCVDTPLQLSDSSTIARTCASWDGTRLALWIEGAGLAREFTAVGSANFNLFGYVLTIEARAGMRQGPFGAWEAFAELTKPFAWGPLTIPLQVADDGSRVTLWLDTTALTAHTNAVGTDAVSNSFTLTLYGPDGASRGSVALPLGVSSVIAPVPPAPDLHPTAPAGPPSVVGVDPLPGETSHGDGTAGTATRADVAAPAPAPAESQAGTRVAPERASLGRY